MQARMTEFVAFWIALGEFLVVIVASALAARRTPFGFSIRFNLTEFDAIR